MDPDPEILGDYCDGAVFNEHPLYSSDHTALQINSYLLLTTQEEGVEFMIDDHVRKCKGTVSVLLADNPASQAIGESSMAF